ncbi:MAG TPA: GTPase [Alphaproteobacteria bacterium]|nr:GTPase [Alphaproteobacteria bacterium]
MRLKSFTAKTMKDAMQMVRDALGEDAIIVATDEEKLPNGRVGAVTLTAAIEPGLAGMGPNFEVGDTGIPAHASDWLQYDDEDEEFAVTEEITDAMLRHGVPEDVMDQVISCATVIGLENPGVALVAAIEHLFNFAPLPTGPSKKAMMLVGAPGAGKTLAAAKLAARATMNGLKVGVITTDTIRAGGVEQLAAFTNLLRVDLHKCTSAKDVTKSLLALDQIIIDTAGVNPFNMQDLKEIAKLADLPDMEPILVLPAGTDAEESAEVARAFAAVGVHHILPTRLDIARRMGGLLSAAYHGALIFADASNTPKVADGLMPLTPQNLSRLLMPTAYRSKEALDTPRSSSDSKKTGTRS